jgi:hypothetical protein
MKALVLNEETFVTDAKGNRVGVVIDLETYQRLREAEEDLADVRAYDQARPKVAEELRAGQATTLADYRAGRGRKSK